MKFTVELDVNNIGPGETRESRMEEASRVMFRLAAAVGADFMLVNDRVPVLDRSGRKIGRASLVDDGYSMESSDNKAT